MRPPFPLSPSSSPQRAGVRLILALALLTTAGCNNFKKGTPSDAGGDVTGTDARRDGMGQGGAGAGEHHDGGAQGGAGGGGHQDGGAVDHPGGVDASHHDAGTDASKLPTSGLVAYYPFNDNTMDESGNGYNATSNLGAFDADRFNRANSAYNLVPNNSSDWFAIVSAPALPISANLTIAFWTKVSPNGNNERIVGVGPTPSGGNTLEFQFSGQQVTFGEHSGQSAVITDPTAITKNSWTFIVGTVSESAVNGDTFTLYRNGVQVASQLFGDYFIGGTASACRFYMGNTLMNGTTANCTGTSEALEYPGDLDDVRVYNRPLSGAEILALYNEAP